MPTFASEPLHTHGRPESLGVLLVNLGTPDAPTPSAVRRYLARFLWDPRVVELPRPLWWMVLHGFILRLRPARSARAYAKIWTEQGSPLLVHSQNLADAVGQRLDSSLAGAARVRLGMSYGAPSIDSAIDDLIRLDARRILCLPLYPQYSCTTTASVFEAVTRALGRRRWVPEFRFVNHYHDAPGFIAAQAQNIREFWERHGRGDRLLFSFHGVPKQTMMKGDPYHCQCQKTARLIAAALGLADGDWQLSFQSRLGRAEWLRPYTDETVASLGEQGLAKLDVVCPGFAADCLETLEEIAMQNAELFVHSGGGSLRYIPALNAREDHAAFISQLVEKHAGGWPEASARTPASGPAERDESRRRALAMGAQQ